MSKSPSNHCDAISLSEQFSEEWRKGWGGNMKGIKQELEGLKIFLKISCKFSFL